MTTGVLGLLEGRLVISHLLLSRFCHNDKSPILQSTYVQKKLSSHKTLPFQIQMSVLIQTTYCIQLPRIEFYMIRSFSSSPIMCIKLCVFTHASFRSDNEFQVQWIV